MFQVGVSVISLGPAGDDSEPTQVGRLRVPAQTALKKLECGWD